MRRIAAPAISARLNAQVSLDADADGTIAVHVEGHALGLGTFSTGAVERAQLLRTGLPLASFAAAGSAVDKEIDLLVRRLARSGFLQYHLGQAGSDNDRIIIEPQMPDYWPSTPKLGDSDTIVLSRFAYLRRRGSEMVLESPRAGALFRICDSKIAAALARFSTPQKIGRLRRQVDFPGTALLALLVDCKILFKLDAAGGNGLRATEGDQSLILWDFHDLLFHSRSTEGRQASPVGGTYPYEHTMPSPPAVRPSWPGTAIDLRQLSVTPLENVSPVGHLLRQRHSIRDFDDQHPIALAELAQFLECTARIQTKLKSGLNPGGLIPEAEYAARPYPSAGSAYELELYLTVANCEGLARGFYHYDADRHALVPIGADARQLEAMLTSAEFAMDAPAAPQILITIAARFGRISWKYSGIAYSLILKDVGVLIQTFYMMATDMGLGGCAIGTSNIDLFARMTGLEFHIEGPVGQFAIGRARKPDTSG